MNGTISKKVWFTSYLIMKILENPYQKYLPWSDLMCSKTVTCWYILDFVFMILDHHALKQPPKNDRPLLLTQQDFLFKLRDFGLVFLSCVLGFLPDDDCIYSKSKINTVFHKWMNFKHLIFLIITTYVS